MRTLWILLLGGCGPEFFTLTPREARLPDLGPPPPAVGGIFAAAPTVRGVVRLTLEPPPVRVVGWSYCRPLISRTVPSEAGVVDPEGHLRWAFVTVTRGLGDRAFEVPGDPVPIAIRGHRFWPHVVGVRAGQDLRIVNQEDHFHDVHALPFDNPEFNLGLPTRGLDTVRRFQKPERMIAIKDDVHPWMRVWVGVVEHPFFAVTGADGAYEFRGLPPGRYTIQVWHERYAGVSREIEVREGALLREDFDLDQDRP